MTRKSLIQIDTQMYQKRETPWLLDTAERVMSVRTAVRFLGAGPIDILDIGCGDGRNTIWISKERYGTWTGIDFVPPKTTGLVVPQNGAFILASVQNDLRKFLPTKKKYDLIVDQGSILIGVSDAHARKSYLNSIASYLKPKGIFVVLVIEGNQPPLVFPDGRVRVFTRLRSLKAECATSNLKLLKWRRVTVSPDSPTNPSGHSLRALHAIFQKRVA